MSENVTKIVGRDVYVGGKKSNSLEFLDKFSRGKNVELKLCSVKKVLKIIKTRLEKVQKEKRGVEDELKGTIVGQVKKVCKGGVPKMVDSPG